jgi:hypothetical protein
MHLQFAMMSIGDGTVEASANGRIEILNPTSKGKTTA